MFIRVLLYQKQMIHAPFKPINIDVAYALQIMTARTSLLPFQIVVSRGNVGITMVCNRQDPGLGPTTKELRDDRKLENWEIRVHGKL